MSRVGFVGLGTMGAPMAGHLATAGHEVAVWNRTSFRSSVWSERYPGSVCISPREVGERSEVAMLCVGNDDDVRAVVLGDAGLLAGMSPGGVIVDHTTASATLARELSAACHARGVGFVDAPVSGGQTGAENGRLTVMCGSDDEGVYERAAAVIAAYAQRCRLMGPAGSGQLTKMVNQICIAGLVQGLAEGLSFAERVGLDGEAVVDVISKGAAQSWQMDNRATTMLAGQFDFGFAVEWMRKDLAICLDEARRSGASLPVAELVDSFYAEVESMGGARWDTSSLIERLRRT